MFQAGEGRWGSGAVRITEVSILDGQRHPAHVFHSGDPLVLRLKIRAEQTIEDFVFGIGLFTADGVCVYATNTSVEDYEGASLSGDAEVALTIDALDLVEGTYKLDVAVHRRDGAPYDYHRLLYTFRVKSRIHDVGIYRPRHQWTFSPAVQFKKPPLG
jgi:hypothetical protein